MHARTAACAIVRGSVNGTPSNAFTVRFGVSGNGFAVNGTANVKFAG